MISRFLVTFILITQTITLAFAADSPKYIFLMIGDGMASAQRQAADFYYRSCQINNGIAPDDTKPLEMNALPVTGLTSTFATNAIITDSAAAATAIATGHKTKNGVLSMDPSKSKDLKTIAEIAKERGRKVGIISNVWINHATPAAFYSHRPSRDMYYEIAVDLANSNFDFYGGGFAHDIEKERIKDKPDPVELARKNNFTIAIGKKQLQNLQPNTGKIWAYDIDMDALDYTIDQRPDRLCLNDFVKKGIQLLYEDNPNGFFIMIEAGKIDWVCHANDAATAIKDTMEFNEVVKTVLNFYNDHANDTLVVVTGDHECGGLRLTANCMKSGQLAKTIDKQTGSDFQFRDITNLCHSENMDFDAAQQPIKDFFGFDELTDKQKEKIKKTYDNDSYIGGKFDYGNKRAITIACTHIVAEKAGIDWTSYSHTGVPVMTTAIGQGQELFGGIYDNTDLSKKLLSLLTAPSKSN